MDRGLSGSIGEAAARRQEIAALLGAPRQALQNAALGIAVVPSLLLLATRGMEILSTVALAMTALAFLLRLPDGRSIPLWRRGAPEALATRGGRS